MDLKDLALKAYKEWDNSWPSLRKDIESGGAKILCHRKCPECCFVDMYCTLSEGATIIQHMQENLSPERFEYFRLRVESTSSSIKRLREDGFSGCDESFSKLGGLECPFLDDGLCAIYEVRPLDCRAQYITSKFSQEECRSNPKSANCPTAENKKNQIQSKLIKDELEINVATPQKKGLYPLMISETLSHLWQNGAPCLWDKMTEEAWHLKVSSLSRNQRDETWQDDRHDLKVLEFQLSLPKEGDYPPDFTLLRQKLDIHELYDRNFAGVGTPEFCSLYKRHSGCDFDWKERKFTGAQEGSNLPYTMWMSDDPQERLMMWEAAKRSRGKVLCGGLGLGVFPQLALSLPRVDSIDIIEMDCDIINFIEGAWSKNPWPNSSRCKIINMKVEKYLNSTFEKYDTVYIDTWDAIYHEYLPHLNNLTKTCKRVLNPGGEILLWAFDMMVQAYMKTAKEIYVRREKYLSYNKEQLNNIKNLYPLVYEIALWLQKNPNCSSDEFQTQSYRLATQEKKNQGILKLSNHPGAQQLLNEKYFSAQKNFGFK